METNFLMSDVKISSTILLVVGSVIAVLLLACVLTKWISSEAIKVMKNLDSLPNNPQHPCVITDKGKTSVSHKVKLFDDVDTLVIQSANIRNDDPNWLTVRHHDTEITLSIENWKHLVSLTHSILPAEKGGVQ